MLKRCACQTVGGLTAGSAARPTRKPGNQLPGEPAGWTASRPARRWKGETAVPHSDNQMAGQRVGRRACRLPGWLAAGKPAGAPAVGRAGEPAVGAAG